MGGSELVQGSNGSVRCFRVPRCYAYPRLKTTAPTHLSNARRGIPPPPIRKEPWLEACSAEVKNMWVYASTSPYGLLKMRLIKRRDKSASA
jgi:hypothetical protein